MKSLLVQFKMFFILLVDLVTAFGALILMLFFRYGGDDLWKEFNNHLVPFSVIIAFFILIFYIFNLYSFRFNKNITELTNSFVKSLFISLVTSVFIFYIFGNLFELTPKTNLVLFTGIFGIIDFYFRILIKRYFSKNNIGRKIVIINSQKNDLIEELEQNQNIGFEIIKKTSDLDLEEIITLNPDAVIIDTNKEVVLDKIYTIIKKGILVYSINNFYEEIFQKVPAEKMERKEILTYMSNNKTVFNLTKRSMDIILSSILILVLFPVFIIVYILIKITSSGPGLFAHKRISLNDSEFTIYKFRSMYIDAEKNGAVWTPNNQTDPRITPLGRFLRKTHLDEIPQLFNILKGDLSFVGPRPERPEFVSNLKKDILYYDLRHCVKAGLTGWAQVNYKYGASTEDAKEKLKYDFYYMKNKSIFFDFLIILKTVAELFRY